MRWRWQAFRRAWPTLPWHWKLAIIGLTLVTIFEIIRTVALPLIRWLA